MEDELNPEGALRMPPKHYDEKSLVCHECISDEIVKDEIRIGGETGKCSFCGEKANTWAIEKLAERVNCVFVKYYEECRSDPISTAHDEEKLCSQEGEHPSIIIAKMLNCSPEISEVIRNYLSYIRPNIYAPRQSNHVAPNLWPSYNPHASYTHRDDVQDPAYSQAWELLCKGIKYSRRFLDTSNQLFLKFIFGSLKSIHVKEYEPGNLKIYRARLAFSKEQVIKIIDEPVENLGPPHFSKATGGRMNAPGIVKFYGALDENTCIAEIRPTVNSFAVVGCFENVKILKILDLTANDSAPCSLSIFSKEYYEFISKKNFLREFQRQIAEPVHPHEEEIEYIPTQVVAEFISNELNYDGLIYASSQADRIGKNIVLFKEPFIELQNPNIYKIWGGDYREAALKFSGQIVTYKITGVIPVPLQQYFLTSAELRLLEEERERKSEEFVKMIREKESDNSSKTI
jgi:hypothetical protein